MQLTNKKTTPLERRKRLSHSILWELQRKFYQRQGIEAWRSSQLPLYITSNTFIADAYAKIVFGFLRDCQASGSKNQKDSQLDLTQPIHIVELGSGHGRFTYLFLKKFLSIYRNSVLKGVPFRYVMTDLAERNVEFWRSHSWLQPFIEQDLLDVARFDIEHDQELRLVESGETLSAATLRNPLIVIANYVFDSIPQDAFYAENSRLYEALITVSPRQSECDLEDPEIFSRLEINYDNNPASEDYYEQPEWNRILRDCVSRLPGTPFLFPTAALQCVQNFQKLSGGRLLLISGDKGYNRDESLLLGQGVPGLTLHASFSMMVDYQIIGEYFLHQGGKVLHPAHRHSSLNISAFSLGKVPGDHVETRQAYAESIEKFGPDDLFTLVSGLERLNAELTIDEILALARLNAWDYLTFLGCIPSLKKQLGEISETQKQELCEAIHQIWDVYYPIGEDNDLAFQLGTLLLEIEYYSEALEFLQHSVDLYGMEPGSAYNMGVCYYSMRKMDEAFQCISKALELDPEFDAAKVMRIKLESSMNRAIS